MNRARPLALSIAALIASACDRKAEEQAEESPPSAATVALEATNTTVVAVAEPGPDAGPDASTWVVGVSLTTIAPRADPTVLETIANARCAREQRCGNIGPDKTYFSMEACRGRVVSDWRDELNAYECRGGIDQKELDECMREIQNEDCGRVFDSLERLVACRSSDICIATR